MEDSRPGGNMELTEEPHQRREDHLSDSKCRIIEMDLGHVVWFDAPEKRGNDLLFSHS